MNHRFGSVVMVVLLSAAGAGISFLPVNWDNADYAPNPEVRAILERRGAPFEPVPGAATEEPPKVPISPPPIPVFRIPSVIGQTDRPAR
jgi:hypothetical protein